MYYIYMDSGTSNTRAYLINDNKLVLSTTENIGTKDSAISGSNDVLIAAMKKCCDALIAKNSLTYDDIVEIWASGMVTNPFGIIEVAHVSTPVDAQKLLDTVYVHYEHKYFKRNINLIRGAKTAQPKDVVTIENIGDMNNVRGEEIEAAGLAATDEFKNIKDFVMVCPGSHTHILHIKNGAVADIVSNFTGELSFAIKKDTILGGELNHDDISLYEDTVLKGYDSLKTYGLCRALYIIHATKVFDVCDNDARTSMLSGIICGSVIDILKTKIETSWLNTQKIVILGGKNHIRAYEIITRHLMPNMEVEIVNNQSFALCGFLELINIARGDSAGV